MNAPSGSRLPRAQWVVFGLLVTLSVGMMGASGSHFAATLQSDTSYILSPVEGALNQSADTLSSYFSALTQFNDLRTQNDQLREQVHQLQNELDRSQAVSELNRDWTLISQAQQDSQYQTIIAMVLQKNLTDIGHKTFIINKGLADGIVAGQVVVDDGGAVVGRILAPVLTYESTVLLVNDTSAVVIGRESGPNADANAVGTVQGQVGGLLQMSYVASTETLTKGMAVVTAGLVDPGGDVKSPYPPGLLIGTIISVSRDPNQVVQSAVLQPAADLSDIEWMLVISNYQGGFASPAPLASPSQSSSGSAGPAAQPTIAPPRITPTPGPTPTPPPGVVTPPPH